MHMPFYPTKGADDPETETDGMRLMLWLSVQAERKDRILNPSNDGVRSMAEDLLRLWHDKESTNDVTDTDVRWQEQCSCRFSPAIQHRRVGASLQCLSQDGQRCDGARRS